MKRLDGIQNFFMHPLFSGFDELPTLLPGVFSLHSP